MLYRSTTQVAGDQAFGPSLTAFPGELAGRELDWWQSSWDSPVTSALMRLNADPSMTFLKTPYKVLTNSSVLSPLLFIMDWSLPISCGPQCLSNGNHILLSGIQTSFHINKPCILLCSMILSCQVIWHLLN